MAIAEARACGTLRGVFVGVPCPVPPMAPTLVRPPFHRDGWVYEEKVDGWRILAYKDGARVRLISRNAVDHTARFRELAAAIVPTCWSSTGK
jgi:ATP-dependent DNA ligase